MKHRKMSFGRISFYFVFFLTKLYASGHSESIDMPLKKKSVYAINRLFLYGGGGLSELCGYVSKKYVFLMTPSLY